MAGRRLSKAKVQKAYLKIGLYGETGTGKTLTGHLIAEKLAELEKKHVAVIDTEHSADFYYKAVPERKIHPQPFDPNVFDRETEHAREITWVTDFLKTIDTDYYGVVVIDSASHLWDSANELWSGRLTSGGNRPIQAYNIIKRAWRQMMDAAVNGKFHFILCGRQQNVFNVEDGDWEKKGTRMRAEKEAGHEPDITCQMLQERQDVKGKTEFEIKMYVEKDRSGILMGKTISSPTAETFMPLYRCLSGEHEEVASMEETAERDVARLEDDKAQKEAERNRVWGMVRDAILAAPSLDAIKTAWTLTKGKKILLGDDLYGELEALRDTRWTEVAQGGPIRAAVAEER